MTKKELIVRQATGPSAKQNNFNYRCLLAGIEALGMKPVYEMFDRLQLSKDPFVQNETLSFDLPDIVGRIQRVLGLNVFLNFYISEDIRDTAKNKMMVKSVRWKNSIKRIFSSKSYNFIMIPISTLN